MDMTFFNEALPNHDREHDPAAADAMEELLQQAGRGDRRAFTRFYEATAPRAYGMVKRMIQDADVADAVVCESYALVWRSAAEWAPSRTSPLAWLLAIVHRCAVQRARVGPERAAADRGPFADDGGDRAVRSAYNEGLTYHQVAAQTGLSDRIVRSRMTDCIQRVQLAGPGASGADDDCATHLHRDHGR